MGGSANLAEGTRGSLRSSGWWRWPLYVRRGALGLLVAGVVLLAGAVTLIPAVSGARAFTVLSGSMRPVLPVGSLAIVRPEPVGSIRSGDVITFLGRDPGSTATHVVTHRVVAVQHGPGGLLFTTRGDADGDPDPGLTSAADVRGVLWYHVPLMGTVREVLAAPAGMVSLAAALLLLIAGHVLTVGRARSRRSW
ncbi:MAG TPA: signal peptidase I [Pseudonocardiaceae bacterium]